MMASCFPPFTETVTGHRAAAERATSFASLLPEGVHQLDLEAV